ncbi:intercellular adhesion molecule 5-like isoform X2 [Lagopus muta]|nr:intercellular adhesion molecule 5-like isoform X2 [Lagopus muta]XP_048788885.1 intercellular adhesion molecule 5-like isoform X2 [Lagopus muta]XP_048788886.1 intercellular adhesion molecule 5-like isoform X2 [Lagopus muta]XP_048788887.1 intercellular adhesion molecule 5-like isoform X2 [Lagopus muta]XP_048788888.1 intercellular adhesion molecule 5-like isoform X2 [Lagopus muta]XP_048788890.1 intercellular adhesion molecule 5-like isoform X2 [Lagopus muta]
MPLQEALQAVKARRCCYGRRPSDQKTCRSKGLHGRRGGAPYNPVQSPQFSSCSVWLQPPVLLVPFGGSLNITCSTSCSDPQVQGGVETSSRHSRQPRNATVLDVTLSDVTEWNSSLKCYFRCHGGREWEKAELIAYRPLDQPELSPIPPLQSGRAHILSCLVPNVSPVRNLTVSLCRGGLTLHTATFWGHSQKQPEDVLVTHEVTARREDHGQSITCRAELDLRPYGPLFNITSTAQLVDIYDFPDPPTLTSSPPALQTTADVHLETGEELNLTCSVQNAFPAANITLLLDGEPLKPYSEDSQSAGTGGLLWNQPGKHKLVCRVRVGPEAQSTELVVNIYDFPTPQLSVSTDIPVAMQNVSGRCELPGGHREGIELRVTVGQRVLAPWGPSPLLFTLLVTEEHDGSELRCEAKVEGRAPKWSDIVRLNVSAPPHMDDQLCPPTHTWTEGQEVNQWCRARGKPDPVVTCHKDGTIILMRQPCVVSRNHSGTYWCSASNALGTIGRSVSVTVEYWDINVGLLVALAVVAVVLAAVGAALYRLYYRKKKIRQYELQKEQQRLLALGGFSDGAAASSNGSAPVTQA